VVYDGDRGPCESADDNARTCGVIQKQGAKGAPFRGKQRPSSGASWDRGSFEMA
jgi:hypothetical protein